MTGKSKSQQTGNGFFVISTFATRGSGTYLCLRLPSRCLVEPVDTIVELSVVQNEGVSSR